MIGELIGNYKVLRLLGQGGMGVVYLAEHRAIGRKAAIKLLLPEFSTNAEMVTRFFNEARAAAMIEHPGMVDVHDFGTHTNGSAYLVMEYLEGESLTAMLQRERKLHIELAIALGRQIASAVNAAHGKGIVHRDLKPDNVFLVRDEEVAGGIRARVLDFGIAKLATDGKTGSLKTRTGALMGTPVYMSPEQCRGAGAVDHRCDIYSLGCILFEMLCGRPPFQKEGLGELIGAHMFEQPPSPGSLEPSIPPALDALILRMLEKDLAQRYQTMAEVLTALEMGRKATPAPLIPSGGTRMYPQSGLPSVAPARAADRQTTFSATAGQVEPARPASGAKLKVLAAVAAAAAVVVVGVMLKGSGSGPPAATTAAAATEAARPARAEPAPPPPPPQTRGAPPAASKVTLKVASDPEGAAVYLASTGVRLGTTPVEYKLAPSAGVVVFLLKRAGYQDQEVEMPADKDASQLFALKKAEREREQKPRGKGKGKGSGSGGGVNNGALDPFGD